MNINFLYVVFRVIKSYFFVFKNIDFINKYGILQGRSPKLMRQKACGEHPFRHLNSFDG